LTVPGVSEGNGYEQRLENLKTNYRELLGVCHMLKRASENEMAPKGDPARAKDLNEVYKSALLALLAINTYIASELKMFMEFGDFTKQFNSLPLEAPESIQ
jgi:hypothetical protein